MNVIMSYVIWKIEDYNLFESSDPTIDPIDIHFGAPCIYQAEESD
jgi:hypothetical protein